MVVFMSDNKGMLIYSYKVKFGVATAVGIYMRGPMGYRLSESG